MALKYEENSRARKSAAHNPNNKIAIGTLIQIKTSSALSRLKRAVPWR
jgi:ribosomal protein S17